MIKINYFFVSLIIAFVALSYFVEKEPANELLYKDFEVLIPDKDLDMQRVESEGESFNIDAYLPSLDDKETRLRHDDNKVPAWTIQVAEYSNKEDLMNNFNLLKKKGFRSYIRYKNKDINRFVLYVGPTIEKKDSTDLSLSIPHLSGYTPEVIPYD